MFSTLTQQFSTIFSRLTGTKTLTPKNTQEVLQKMHDALLEADVPQAIAHEFIARMQADIMGQKVTASLSPAQHFMTVAHKNLVTLLSVSQNVDIAHLEFPATILFVGQQGSGKTTSIAKIAHWLKQQKPRARIATTSLDFNRPAAREQLELLAHQSNITYYAPIARTTPAAAQEIAENLCIQQDVTLIDTAGRLSNDSAVLQELKIINACINPSYTLLVIDAMTGQQSAHIARTFQDTLNITGIMLSKMDSDTRAGAAFACTYQIKKPIVFMGTGEKIDDIELFTPERVATQIIGMGDLAGLEQRARTRIKQDEQENLMQKMAAGVFTLEEFAAQLDMVSRLGSLKSIMRYVPGAPTIDDETLARGEAETRGIRAIIQSMTPHERRQPALLNHSRMHRIARGAGVAPSSVRAMLVKFEQTQRFVKLLKRT